MRTIKFRAWDKRNKEMVYSDKEDCFYVNQKGVLFMYAIPKSEAGLESKYIKSYDVMQFTGLTDKNGKEIYEGDLMNHPEFQPEAQLQIRIVDGCTYAENWDCVRTDLSLGEVVGNIHEI